MGDLRLLTPPLNLSTLIHKSTIIKPASQGYNANYFKWYDVCEHVSQVQGPQKKKKSKKAGVCSYVNYAIDHILSWGLSVIFKQNVVSFT